VAVFSRTARVLTSSRPEIPQKAESVQRSPDRRADAGGTNPARPILESINSESLPENWAGLAVVRAGATGRENRTIFGNLRVHGAPAAKKTPGLLRRGSVTHTQPWLRAMAYISSERPIKVVIAERRNANKKNTIESPRRKGTCRESSFLSSRSGAGLLWVRRCGHREQRVHELLVASYKEHLVVHETSFLPSSLWHSSYGRNDWALSRNASKVRPEQGVCA